MTYFRREGLNLRAHTSQKALILNKYHTISQFNYNILH